MQIYIRADLNPAATTLTSDHVGPSAQAGFLTYDGSAVTLDSILNSVGKSYIILRLSVCRIGGGLFGPSDGDGFGGGGHRGGRWVSRLLLLLLLLRRLLMLLLLRQRLLLMLRLRL